MVQGILNNRRVDGIPDELEHLVGHRLPAIRPVVGLFPVVLLAQTPPSLENTLVDNVQRKYTETYRDHGVNEVLRLNLEYMRLGALASKIAGDGLGL